MFTNYTKNYIITSNRSIRNSSSSLKDANLSEFLEKANLTTQNITKPFVRFIRRNKRNLIINTSLNTLRNTQHSAELNRVSTSHRGIRFNPEKNQQNIESS